MNSLSINTTKVKKTTNPPALPSIKKNGISFRVSKHVPLISQINLNSTSSSTSVLSPSEKNPDSLDHSFNEVIQYLPNATDILARSSYRGNEIQHLTNLLSVGNWDSIVSFYNASNWDSLAYDALYAFQDKKITLEQFSTLIFRWSIQRDFPEKEIKAIPLFNADGTINEYARNCIEQTTHSKLKKNLFKCVSSADLEKFYLKMKLAPLSEQYFFQIQGNHPQFNDCFDVQKNILITEVIQKTGLNIFNEFIPNNENNAARMVASLSMMQQILIAFQEDTAVKIRPVIGLSSEEDIANNGLNGTRDMALPFPGELNFPKSADLLLAPTDWDFWNHDFYHAFVASHIPDSSRKMFIEVGRVIQRKLPGIKDDPQMHLFFREFFERTIDMEASGYRKKGSNHFIFVETIFDNFENTFRRLRSNESFTKDIKEFLNALKPVFEVFVQELNSIELFKRLTIYSFDLDSLQNNIEGKIKGFEKNDHTALMAIEFFKKFIPFFEVDL